MTQIILGSTLHNENRRYIVNHSKLRKLPGAICLVAIVIVSGCHKKVVAPPPPPPPPPPAAAPTASISVSPSAIDPGQSATLSWQTANASDASITGIGTVAPDGTQAVSPSTSTSYTLTAKGPGGSVQSSARITVNPPPPPPVPVPPSMTEEQMFEQNMHDVYFDYDQSSLRAEDLPVAAEDAAFLQKYQDIKIVIEGHCDERGSAEYNIALGQERGESLQKSLLDAGVSANRIRVVSLGKEKPFCTESNEQCWHQNRRDHLKLDR
jgi:peptidoglycan-associated lipoprotein